MEDTGDDRIATAGIRTEHLAGEAPAFENRALRSAGPDFGGYFEPAERSRKTARTITDAEF